MSPIQYAALVGIAIFVIFKLKPWSYIPKIKKKPQKSKGYEIPFRDVALLCVSPEDYEAFAKLKELVDETQ